MPWFVELEYKIPKTDEADSVVIEFGYASIATLLLGPKLDCMLLLGKGDTGVTVGCSFRGCKAAIGLLMDALSAASGCNAFGKKS